MFQFIQTAATNPRNRRGRRKDTKKLRQEMEARGRKLDEIQNFQIDFGINPNLKYYKGREKPVRVANVFLWGEFGTRRQPARPAVRDLWKRKKSRYASYHATAVEVYLLPRYKSGGWKPRLQSFGKRIVFDIKNAIKAYKKIANAADTIKRKGFNNPLIETGKMVNSWEARVYRNSNKASATRNFRNLGRAMAQLVDKINAQAQPAR